MPSKTTIKRKCDKCWSEKVKERAKHKCEFCGSTAHLNSHHVITRSNHILRYALENGCCLCAKHHCFDNQSAHKNPVWFIEWFAQRRPNDYDWLREHQWLPPEPIGIKDYEKILTSLSGWQPSTIEEVLWKHRSHPKTSESSLKTKESNLIADITTHRIRFPTQWLSCQTGGQCAVNAMNRIWGATAPLDTLQW